MLMKFRPPAKAFREKELPPPLYCGGVRLHDWKNTARGGMTVDLGISDVSPSEIHPFKGLLCGKDHGQRMRAWIGPHSDVCEVEDSYGKSHYSGETVLLRWSDDSVNGMSVKLLLDDGPDGSSGKHPFDGFAIGRKEGELLNLICWALAEDESFVHPARTRRKTPFAQLTPVRQANILCRDSAFVSFLAGHEKELVDLPVDIRPEDDPAEYAARTVRAHLGIESRAVLNYENREGAAARTKWELLMRRYFESDEHRQRR